MKILVPYVSCVCSEDEFKDVVGSYSTIYVTTSDGFLKHQNLVGGRSVRLKIPSLPAEAVGDGDKLKEELNFLPDGKIPKSILHQITKFFKEVITHKKAEYEAHCFVLWTKEKGYHVSVPKQTVSKAAVSFSYDASTLPSGSIIVLDMHSHNTMSSFFSGTDNNNDKGCIYYSGVIGNLDKEPTMVFRFNFRELNYPVQVDEIFEIPSLDIVQIDPTWLDQISVPEPHNYPPKYGQITPFYDQESSKLYGFQEDDYIIPPVDFDNGGRRRRLEDIDPVGLGDDDYEYIIGDALDFVMDNHHNDENLKLIINEAYQNLTENGRRHYATNGFIG
jgi:PRTRC genetic system protein A